MWFERQVVVIRRVVTLPQPVAEATLWERTPKFVLVILALAGAFAGKIGADILHGSLVLQWLLASIGAIFGFYVLKILPRVAVLLIYAVALALLIAVAVWIEHRFIQ